MQKPIWNHTGIRTRGRLPHWDVDRGIYFITYRLADSLPSDVLLRLRSNIEKVERYLDAGSGQCFLRDPRVARIVADNLKHFDGLHYRLLAWCVMPNHVHVVIDLYEGKKLSRVVHSWKSYTASKANDVLGRRGAFWQREYFDRCIRDEEEFDRTIEYVMNNPIAAGLRNWPWVWPRDEG